MSNSRTIAARELGKASPQGVILDVRTAMEHGEKRLGLPHAHVPLDELDVDAFARRQGLGKDADIYILCRSGGRAARAARKFAEKGFTNVHVIEGGIVACEECGQQLEGSLAGKTACSSGPISLERQVRIAAGLIAALGAALGLTVHPFFGIIPLFVGCGLVFAGITDRCGMALLLTRAPWNKIP